MRPKTRTWILQLSSELRIGPTHALRLVSASRSFNSPLASSRASTIPKQLARILDRQACGILRVPLHAQISVIYSAPGAFNLNRLQLSTINS
jgi:hypothetical protein